MRHCAYCGSDGPLTREHLWPESLHRRLIEVSDEKLNKFWDRRTGKIIQGEPTLRDVCASCNNGLLSSLDSYICEVFDRSLVHIPQRFEKVTFEYDYHRLKRWLLKMCFNSARMNSSADALVFPPLLPYLLGESESVGRSVLLYVQLSF